MHKERLCLSAKQISFFYNHRPILRDVSCTVESGSLTAVIGPNGAGKSTLLRILGHLLSPTHGSVSIDPIGDIGRLSTEERARYIGWVADHGPLPFAFSVFDTVRLGRYGRHNGRPTGVDDEATISALRHMEIEHLEKRDVTSLSSGERQKTMIARLLAGETPILLLDEPLASLDIGSSLKLLSLLRKKAQNGATICLTIHDLPLAYRFVDHILCLSHGELVADGPAKEVLLSPLVRQAFGVEPSIETGLVLNTFP